MMMEKRIGKKIQGTDEASPDPEVIVIFSNELYSDQQLPAKQRSSPLITEKYIARMALNVFCH
jgi:hypothetical protein